MQSLGNVQIPVDSCDEIGVEGEADKAQHGIPVSVLIKQKDPDDGPQSQIPTLGQQCQSCVGSACSHQSQRISHSHFDNWVFELRLKYGVQKTGLDLLELIAELGRAQLINKSQPYCSCLLNYF